MSSDAELPQEPAAVTADWLTAAVADAYPQARARRVEVLDAHSGTTGRARIAVEWEGREVPADRLFLKLPPVDPTSREMVITTGMGRREARFYEHVAAHVPVRVPRPLFAAANDAGTSYLMVLEDLESGGCTFPGFQDARLAQYAETMMRSLARLHAGFRAEAAPDALRFIEGPMKNDWGRILVQSALEQFEDEMPAEFGELGHLYLDANDAFQALLEEGAPTLLHGDPHLGNLFLDGEEVGYLDWACACRSPGARDVAYFCCGSLPVEVRREHQDALLEIYRATLEECGVIRDREEIREDYRRFAAYGWLAAVTTLAAGDRMQRIEVGRRATTQANTALRDLGTVSFFRERLG